MNNLEQEINVTLSNKVKKIKELYQIFDEIIFDLIKHTNNNYNQLFNNINIETFNNHFKIKYSKFNDFYFTPMTILRFEADHSCPSRGTFFVIGSACNCYDLTGVFLTPN
jgi:hypothetical protein